MSSSPVNRRKNVTSFPCSPFTLNPFMTFLHTNNSTVIQRTLQSRKLFSKINKINAIITDEKIKWHSSNNVSELGENKENKEKINMLLNKNQAPLQMNPRIKMRNAIENIMKLNNIKKPKSSKLSLESPKTSERKAMSSTNFNKNNNNIIDLKSINKSIKQISQISRYFDKVFKIDKKQRYLKIDTLDYWKKIDTTPRKKKELIGIYNRVHKDEKFTFSEYQKEYETKWLEILKNLEEKDKGAIFFLINGGVHEDGEEEQIKAFDPNKIIQKMEYKLLLDERKNKKNKEIFLSKEEQILPEKNQKESKENTANILFQTQRQISQSRQNLNNITIDKRKNYSDVKNNLQTNNKPTKLDSFDQIKEVNSPFKIRSQVMLKNFLHENLSSNDNNENNRNNPLKSKKISLDSEKMSHFQKNNKKPPLTSGRKPKKIDFFSHNFEDIQECNCKHAHNILCYQLKKNHKSIFKIPSVLPPTQKTFQEIRRVSNLMNTDPEIIHNLIYQNFQNIDEEKNFLQLLKNNINESYETNSQSMKLQKIEFILQKY